MARRRCACWPRCRSRPTRWWARGRALRALVALPRAVPRGVAWAAAGVSTRRRPERPAAGAGRGGRRAWCSCSSSARCSGPPTGGSRTGRRLVRQRVAGYRRAVRPSGSSSWRRWRRALPTSSTMESRTTAPHRRAKTRRDRPRRPLAAAEWGAPVAMLVALFATFVWTQLGTLFGGLPYVMDPQGPDFADYARTGFVLLAARDGADARGRGGRGPAGRPDAAARPDPVAGARRRALRADAGDRGVGAGPHEPVRGRLRVLRPAAAGLRGRGVARPAVRARDRRRLAPAGRLAAAGGGRRGGGRAARRGRGQPGRADGAHPRQPARATATRWTPRSWRRCRRTPPASWPSCRRISGRACWATLARTCRGQGTRGTGWNLGRERARRVFAREPDYPNACAR